MVHSPCELPYTVDASTNDVTLLTCCRTPALSTVNTLRLNFMAVRVASGLTVPLSVKLDMKGSPGGTGMGALALAAGRQHSGSTTDKEHEAVSTVGKWDQMLVSCLRLLNFHILQGGRSSWCQNHRHRSRSS